MQAFDNQRLVSGDGSDALTVYFFALNKIEDGNIHFFPGQKIIHLGVKQIQFQGAQGFEIGLTVGQQRGFVPF